MRIADAISNIFCIA